MCRLKSKYKDICLVLVTVATVTGVSTLLAVLFSGYNERYKPQEAQTYYSKNAFSNDINGCLFHAWTMMTPPVLANDVQCSSYGGDYKGLCYGTSTTALTIFAMCYNQHTKTPAYTGNVIAPSTGSGRRKAFKKDTGQYAPAHQAEVADYLVTTQLTDFPTFDQNGEHFCAKGHLTPNSDFGPSQERALTFILTNIAPQWQTFNGGNWAILENGVRNYVNGRTKTVYVFTGVGGEAKDGNGTTYKMNKQVTAPKYYWKLICDPSIKEMIVYVGKNPVGNWSTALVAGCRGSQTEERGVFYCDSYNKVNAAYPGLFKLPDMHPTNCPSGTRGSFLDTYVTLK